MNNSSLNSKKQLARDDIVRTLNKLLLGPFEEYETLDQLPQGSGPQDYYLTGILWPPHQIIKPEEDENLQTAEDDDSEDVTSPLYSVFKPSSIGLTCTFKDIKSSFKIIVYGARYTKEISSENNDNCSIWKRQPFKYSLNIPNTDTRFVFEENTFETPAGDSIIDYNMSIYVKKREINNHLIVTASLLNKSTDEMKELGERCIFQTKLEIECSKNSAIISRNIPGIDLEVNDLLYRDSKEFAVGHAVASMWNAPINNEVESVWTSWIPSQKVFSFTAEGHPSMKDLILDDFSPFNTSILSDMKYRIHVLDGLKKFCDIYQAWITTEKQKIDGLDIKYQELATNNLNFCNDKILSRMRNGIKILQTSDNAYKAFYYANLTMNKQSEYSNIKPLKWRPFQLAFILLTIPSIVNPDSDDRKLMDLLWFPTGGGKTEAYLGLTAFTIFYRRLHEKEKSIKPHVDVLMRYTLRLLTVQQFQRAAKMICTANLIRKAHAIELGTLPISIGLYVGESATPNYLHDSNRKLNAYKVLQDELNGQKPSSTPRLILQCPICSTNLKVCDYYIDEKENKMKIICSNKKCFTKGEPLPIHTVDEEIYKELPSLIIGTVDKFAQLPRNNNLGLIFGKPDGLPPDLIIQDELHLISGPLGTVTGIYESAIDYLSTFKNIPPKIIGSTATIGRAEQQVKALFNRDVHQFPPPGLDASNSFFAVVDEKIPDRTYLGISSGGRSPKFTLQAVIAAFQIISKFFMENPDKYDVDAIDPYWTSLLYFNSLRELGGASVMMRDDVQKSILFYSNRLKCNKRDLQYEPVELTSRIPSTEIPEKLKTLNNKLSDDLNPPVDTILASNMISVGVDIPRLGLMVVNGQPKATSEYIQATSRIGRGIPGLILTVYNASRPRDMSHYEHFYNYHQALYRRVESTSVTPWSSRARDKALHAVLISILRYSIPELNDRFDAINFKSNFNEIDRVISWLVERAMNSGIVHITKEEITNELSNIITQWARRAENYRESGQRFEYWATRRPFDNKALYPHLMRSAEEFCDSGSNNNFWQTPNSMRDVEPSIYFTLFDK